MKRSTMSVDVFNKKKTQKSKKPQIEPPSKWIETATFFSGVFAQACFSDPEFARKSLNIMLNGAGLIEKDAIGPITKIEIEKTVQNMTTRKVIFDVYCEDDSGSLFDIEIQVQTSKMPPERVRIYASALDSLTREKSHSYKDVKQSYLIVIFQSDPVGDDEMYYVIERCYRHSKKPFNDGSYIVFINGSKESDTLLGQFIHDCNKQSPSEMKLPFMAERASLFKSNKEVTMHFSEADDEIIRICMHSVNEKLIMEEAQKGFQKGLQEGKQEGLQEGRQEGLQLEKENIARNLLNLGFKIDDIIKATGLTHDKVMLIASANS